MPKGMTPRDRRVKKATKPIRKKIKNAIERIDKIKDIEKKPRKVVPPRKMPNPKTLGPLRPIRERAKESRLVGGKSKLTKPKR